METYTYYRFDRFNGSSGFLIGFFADKQDALSEVNCTEVDEFFDQSGEYYQLTTFTSTEELFIVDAWQNELTEILSIEYFQPL